MLQHCGRRAYFDITHARPVEPLDQSRELCGRQAHDAVLDLRLVERAFLQPLGEQAQSRAIPDDHFDPVSALGAEHEHGAGEPISTRWAFTRAARPSMALRKSIGLVAIRTFSPLETAIMP
jgi:hypothetical protein